MKVSIKALRVNANMSQQEAAEKLGITVRTLQSWESHVTYPTAPQLIKLASVYNCSLDDIFLPDTLAKSEKQ